MDYFSQNDLILNDLLKKYAETSTPISVNFRELVNNISNTDRFTHFIHSYPAKLLQHIPFFLLNNNILSKPKDIVLDPFSGSGTVALESMLSNRHFIGTDINPLAVLIAKTKTTPINTEKVQFELKRIAGCVAQKNGIKKPSNTVTNLDYWYNPEISVYLEKLRQAISHVEERSLKQFFEIAFSTCTRRFSHADPNISVPVKIKPQRFSKIERLKDSIASHLKNTKENNIFPFFEETVYKNLERVKQLNNYVEEYSIDPSQINIHECDIKENTEEIIAPESIQLIISSPPYVSAQKYIRASRLNIEWLRLNKEATSLIEHASIGREHILKKNYKHKFSTGNQALNEVLDKIYTKNPSRANITSTYMKEMSIVFEKLYTLLKPGGFFVLIIGNNVISGYEFKTNEFLLDLAEKTGFTTKLVLIDDIKSRGLMTNRNKTASLISREYVILLQK